MTWKIFIFKISLVKFVPWHWFQTPHNSSGWTSQVSTLILSLVVCSTGHSYLPLTHFKEKMGIPCFKLQILIACRMYADRHKNILIFFRQLMMMLIKQRKWRRHFWTGHKQHLRQKYVELNIYIFVFDYYLFRLKWGTKKYLL